MIPYLLLFIAIILFKQNKIVVSPPIVSIHNNPWRPKLGQSKKEKTIRQNKEEKNQLFA